MYSRLTHLGLALPGAALATIALFWLMIVLIAQGLPAITEEIVSLRVNFTRVDRDETVQLKDRSLPNRPDALELPPPLPPPATSAPRNTASGTGGVPLVRVPPMSPQRALLRGWEGWVRLKFDISPTGKVEDPQVVDAMLPIIFNRAAKMAVMKWRYKPRIIDGRPVRQTDVEVVISFYLDRNRPDS